VFAWEYVLTTMFTILRPISSLLLSAYLVFLLYFCLRVRSLDVSFRIIVSLGCLFSTLICLYVCSHTVWSDDDDDMHMGSDNAKIYGRLFKQVELLRRTRETQAPTNRKAQIQSVAEWRGRKKGRNLETLALAV
jgi:FlaA1/EpsC-like NDP-sugar epimerase